MKYIYYTLFVVLTSCSQKDNQDGHSTVLDSSVNKIDDIFKTDSLQKNNVLKNFPPNKLSLFDFSTIEKVILDTLKLEILRKIVFTEYLLPSKFETNESHDFENYHILDFNADSRLDIIYDGRNPMGIETNNVVFFLNQGDSLRPVIKLNGDFTELKIKDHQLQSFQLIKSPCCADYIYKLENYEFNNSDDCFEPENGDDENYKYSYGQVNNPRFCVSLNSQFAYVLKTEFPTAIKSINNSIVTTKGFVTPRPLEPTSIDFEEDGMIFRHSDNKAFTELHKGIECQILSEKSHSNGETYCFITFSNIEKINNYMSNIDFEQYGWINKRNLK